MPWRPTSRRLVVAFPRPAACLDQIVAKVPSSSSSRWGCFHLNADWSKASACGDPATTTAVLGIVTSANVACGFPRGATPPPCCGCAGRPSSAACASERGWPAYAPTWRGGGGRFIDVAAEDLARRRGVSDRRVAGDGAGSLRSSHVRRTPWRPLQHDCDHREQAVAVAEAVRTWSTLTCRCWAIARSALLDQALPAAAAGRVA